MGFYFNSKHVLHTFLPHSGLKPTYLITMTRLPYQSKSLLVKRPGLVRRRSDAIPSSKSRGGEFMGLPPACKQQRMNRRLSGSRGARGRGFAYLHLPLIH